MFEDRIQQELGWQGNSTTLVLLNSSYLVAE